MQRYVRERDRNEVLPVYTPALDTFPAWLYVAKEERLARDFRKWGTTYHTPWRDEARLADNNQREKHGI